MNLIQALTRRFWGTPGGSRIAAAVKEQASRDFVSTAAASGLITLANGLAGILAARLLGPAGRGEFAAAIVWGAVLNVVASLGMPQALTFFVARDEKAVGAIFRVTLFVWIIQSIAVVALGMILINGLLGSHQPDALRTGRIYLYSVPFAMLAAFLATLAQGLRRFALFNGLRVLPALAYLAGLIVATVVQFNRADKVASLLVICQVLTTFVGIMVFIVRVKPNGRLELKRIPPLLGYGLKSYWGSVSWITNARLDQFIMSLFVGLDVLGYYAVAVSYASLIYPLAGVFAMVLFPQVAGAGGVDEAKRRISRAFRSNIVLSGASVLGLGLLAPWLVPALFGARFGPSVPPALVLLAGTVFLGSNYILSDGLRGMGKPLATSIAEIIGAIITVAGLFLLLPPLGIMGAAITSVISYGAVTAVLLRMIARSRAGAAAA